MWTLAIERFIELVETCPEDDLPKATAWLEELSWRQAEKEEQEEFLP